MAVKGIIWGVFGAALLGVSGTFAWKVLNTHNAPAALPVLATLPDFSLTDQNGSPVTLKSLKGSPWVADFIYTRCPGQCLLITQKMVRVQSLIPAESQIQLVSISVDPSHDTPPVLARYAQHYQAQPRWHFLTGPEPDIARLMRHDFKLPFDGSMVHHSTKMVLVDSEGRIRGYFDALNEMDMQRLVAALSQEGTSL